MVTRPKSGTPFITDTFSELERCAQDLAAGHGPVAIDAERASGFRYGQRAFLIQIKREGSGLWLIDPEAFSDLRIIHDALRGVEWILHAATQDLPCLAEVGMWPDRLFDTELAGRLAGFPRVGLAALLENKLNLTLAKEHSAADWSVRPLPADLRDYAALDVEFLVELRAAMVEELTQQDKLAIAEEEFAAIRKRPLPEPRKDPWRRTSGISSIRTPEKLAIVRSLWTARENLAESRDVAPSRLIKDQAIIAAATAEPTTVPQLLKLPAFVGRAASKEAPRWLRAIREGQRQAEQPDELPALRVHSTTPPPPRAWSDRDPLAARRLQTARSWIGRAAEANNMPTENLLTPATLKEICWRPPANITPDSVRHHLVELGARNWQVEIVSPILTVALLDPDPLD
ncbi:HRDC domain-containing protein [Citricoccus sp. NR2]|nr:HRDC domain-containing protein [Citricoccus sp. NR2]WBL20669.1 HRDC domain-containing protein [Citricoccus sp. NR2]